MRNPGKPGFRGGGSESQCLGNEVTDMKKARGKPVRKTSDVGQAVIASLREIHAWQRGELSLKVTDRPDTMPAMRVKAIRRKAPKSVRI